MAQRDYSSGQAVRQTTDDNYQSGRETAVSAAKSTGSPSFPVLLNDEQSAACLGVSVRKFHELRQEPWMPLPVVLGPRLLRWPRAELERSVAEMPRQRQAGTELNRPGFCGGSNS